MSTQFFSLQSFFSNGEVLPSPSPHLSSSAAKCVLLPTVHYSLRDRWSYVIKSFTYKKGTSDYVEVENILILWGCFDQGKQQSSTLHLNSFRGKYDISATWCINKGQKTIWWQQVHIFLSSSINRMVASLRKKD